MIALTSSIVEVKYVLTLRNRLLDRSLMAIYTCGTFLIASTIFFSSTLLESLTIFGFMLDNILQKELFLV